MRTCLLMWVIHAMGGTFLLEQPRSSMVLWHPRVREFMKSLPKASGCCFLLVLIGWCIKPRLPILMVSIALTATPIHPILSSLAFSRCLPGQVFLTYWWMQHFGGLTAKRHLGVSNAATIGELDWGRLKASVRSRLSSSKAKSAITYRSKSGRVAFKGSRFLKSTGWGS